MATLSITTAWNETAAFVRREGRLLFPLAFMLMALPIGLIELLMPPPPPPGQLPEAGAWLLFMPVALISSMIGNLALSALSLRQGLSVGEAMGRGLRRFPILLGVLLLLLIVGAVLFLIAASLSFALVPGALEAAQAGAPTPAIGVMLLILLPAMIYIGARMVLLTPLAANEDGGPFRLIGRSSRLTSGHVLKLVGFLILVGLATGILTAAIESVVGLLFALITGSIEPRSTGALLVLLVMLAVNTVVSAYLAVMVARVYAQLAEGSSRGA